jgi:transketolase
MLTMRDQMAQTIEDTMARDERVMLVLAEISRTPLDGIFRKYPDRAVNVGIMEQTMVSVAAGIAVEGFIPVVHSIAPFLAERPFEQLKDDFCYQRLGGNFISIGGSYDYSTEGMTHHGPGDVPILRSLPGMRIVVPGTPAEFDALFREAYASGAPTYYRLGLTRNPDDRPVRFGQLDVVRRGRRATVFAVGPMLAPALAAVADLDVTVLYCTTVAPFDGETLREASASGDIVLVEPYYAGTLVPDVVAAMGRTPVRVAAIGVPREVLTRYGTPQEHDVALGLTPEGIRRRIDAFLSD